MASYLQRMSLLPIYKSMSVFFYNLVWVFVNNNLKQTVYLKSKLSENETYVMKRLL